MKENKEHAHLPLDGEESLDQPNLVGSVMKKAVSPLVIERAVGYAEALDALDETKETVESCKDDLVQALRKSVDRDIYVEVSTMKGNKHRFFLTVEEKLCKEKS